MVGGTVKQFKDALEEMKKLFPYNEEKTRISTIDEKGYDNHRLTIVTTDEETGIFIQMSKQIDREGDVEIWR